MVVIPPGRKKGGLVNEAHDGIEAHKLVIETDRTVQVSHFKMHVPNASACGDRRIRHNNSTSVNNVKAILSSPGRECKFSATGLKTVPGSVQTAWPARSP